MFTGGRKAPKIFKGLKKPIIFQDTKEKTRKEKRKGKKKGGNCPVTLLAKTLFLRNPLPPLYSITNL